MQHPLFVEILTIGLFISFNFNWNKIVIRARLSFRRFWRSHIAGRVHNDFDLDELGPTYGQAKIRTNIGSGKQISYNCTTRRY